VLDLSDLRNASPFDSHYGLELTLVTPDEVRAEVQVADHHRQPAGLVHGGVLASMAETVASIGTWVAVHDDGKVAMGMANQATFLRSVRDGTLRAVGRPRHRGRTTWVWDVEIADEGGRVCALVRMTIAVRDAREG
jgi:1,4-dihydroxy-2-naphthoyl-CoA hydrolase